MNRLTAPHLVNLTIPYLKNLDLKLTGDHIKVAKWNVGEVKKVINAVGQSKAERPNKSRIKL